MAPLPVTWRRPTGVSNWTKEICSSVLQQTTQDIDAVSSRSAFTEDLAAVQGWKTKHDKSTIPSYTNIKLYTEVRGVAKTRHQVSKSSSDIKSLTLSLWHWGSDIESLTSSLWHVVCDIESLTSTDIDLTNWSFLTFARRLRITL